MALAMESGGVTLAARASVEQMRDFRRVASSFTTGVTVASGMVDDVPVAMTVNSFTTVSLDPMLLLICLHRRSRLLSWIEQSGVFALTVLAADQQSQARWFANPTRPTGLAAFAGIRAHRAPATGCLLLSDGLAYFDCQVHRVDPGGDHVVIMGTVLAFGQLHQRKRPLLFINGEFPSGQ